MLLLTDADFDYPAISDCIYCDWRERVSSHTFNTFTNHTAVPTTREHHNHVQALPFQNRPEGLLRGNP